MRMYPQRKSIDLKWISKMNWFVQLNVQIPYDYCLFFYNYIYLLKPEQNPPENLPDLHIYAIYARYASYGPSK